ncbi:hypothetical protein AGDE_11715 [Angomonas deanei]|uniref:Uncharacterized protein n=1 Tax=Angomonas deanei TaxID=59799 RepID=A0A7G2C718_9TRYP|nr:hypothetical protein AGDE_11715 [Angomonas deanei]CAD2215536.1 hypothetical protein, conserved [Angomonas deanei]|eukprot:EPY25755.1 hypothetical protein AGDE_11715 [Angomonas deanei]
MENRFNVEVVRLPYEINGIQLLAPKDSSQVNVPQRKYSFSEKGLHMPIGSRGIRELAKHQQNSSDAVAPKAADEPLKIVTLHRKGILAVWDCSTHQLVGVCDHGGNVNVEECSTTKDFIITRVVCSPGHDALEEDNNLYIWDADTTEKVATLRGHHGRVTTYALHATNKNVVVTAGMDSVMFVWDLSKNYDEPIQKIDIRDMGGILTCSTIVKDYIICGGTTRSVGVWNIATGQLLALTDNVPSSTTAIHVVEETHSNTEDTLLTVHAASTDGFIAELQVRISGGGAAAAITPVWKNQYHTASATSIAVDGDVVVSCSTFDGVKIFHRKTGIHRVVGAKGERSASRAFVLDSANKKILVGQDDGALCELSYSAFAAQTSKNLDMISVVHPLTTAITGILIEVSAGNVWERVLCSSVDGVVSILDYSFQSRSTESVNCVRLASQQFIGKLGDGVVGVVPPDRIAEVDFLDVRRLNKVAKSVSLSSPVTALTADVERALCVVGCKNGNVTVFQFANDEARAAAEWSFKHYRVTYIAKHLSGVFAVGFSREDEFTGGVSVLNMHTPTVGSAKPLELDRSIPAVVYMLGHHSVVAQGPQRGIDTPAVRQHHAGVVHLPQDWHRWSPSQSACSRSSTGRTD